jgi:hypothetical protein
MSNSLNNYKFVVATEYNEEDFWNKAKISVFLEKTGHSETAEIIYNNKKGLPAVYNSFITEDNRDNFLVFVHDDVFIDDLFIEEKLNIAFEKYDIVGLAGATSCDLSAQVLAWHLMSSRDNHVGEVAHSNGSIVWTTVFGSTESRALVIDGLFIAVNTAKLLDTDTRFDENFDFHHYDISFCLKANQNKLKIGVTSIKLTHFGLGDSMNSPEWQKSAEKFRKLYKK